MFKKIITSLLEHQTKRLLRQHRPRVIAITGSVGKTSTKLFTATVLGLHYRVLAHEENHNSEISIPLSIFEIELPDQLKNPFSWLQILWYTQRRIRQPFNYDVIVVELGTDHPGDIARFRKYLKPDIAIVTAVAIEHMEFFKTIEAVAKEEMAVVGFSDVALLGHDDIDPRFMQYAKGNQLIDYGLKQEAEYHYTIETYTPEQGFTGKFVSPEFGEMPVTLQLIGEHNVKSAVAAGAVAARLGLSAGEIVAGMQRIRPISGRMQLLRGMDGSLIIDDTYNSSPQAAFAALYTLYAFPAKQRIAILGSMNELGASSKSAHEDVGFSCDPTKLEWVVTVGAEAEQYLAPAAASRGCQVRSFQTPYEAGTFVHQVLRAGAVILAKGSQNRIFTEETVKMLLHDTEDEHKLVRQSPKWLEIKRKQFDKTVMPLIDE